MNIIVHHKSKPTPDSGDDRWPQHSENGQRTNMIPIHSEEITFKLQLINGSNVGFGAEALIRY